MQIRAGRGAELAPQANWRRPRPLTFVLRKGRTRVIAVATRACPTSCRATTDFSIDPGSDRFFSMPAIDRRMAALKSSMSTVLLSFRPASSAASFTRFARSAPDVQDTGINGGGHTAGRRDRPHLSGPWSPEQATRG